MLEQVSYLTNQKFYDSTPIRALYPYLNCRSTIQTKNQMDHNHSSLKIIDLRADNDKKAYKEIITKEFHNPYYSLEYLEYHLGDSNKMIAFVLEDSGANVAIMPMILRPIPHTDYWDAISAYGYSGPLFIEHLDPSLIHFFWSNIDQWYLENKVVTEFIRFSLTGNHVHYSGNCVHTLTNVCGDLKNSFEAQWESFGKKVRNNYRKAQSMGLTFQFFDPDSLTPVIITNFYKIYYKTMQRNNASEFLFFSDHFFQQLVMNNKKDFSIAMVYSEGKPISTELHIHYDNSVYAFLGGTDSDFFLMRPNDFLRVEVIKWAIANQKKKYILGGGIKNNDGLYKSKKAFFPKDEDCTFYTGRKVINKNVYDALVEKVIHERGISQDESYFPLYRKP